MKYTQSEYAPYMKEAGVRIEVYPNNEVAAKTVAAYEEMGFSTVPLYQLIAHGANNLPSPKKMISQVESYASNCRKNIVFTGLDAYLLLQNNEDQNDFIIGLRGLVDKDKGTVRFLISSRFDLKKIFANPRYKDSLQLVEFEGAEVYDENPVSIKLIRNDWCASNRISVSPKALEAMGNYAPKGAFVFTITNEICRRQATAACPFYLCLNRSWQKSITWTWTVSRALRSYCLRSAPNSRQIHGRCSSIALAQIALMLKKRRCG